MTSYSAPSFEYTQIIENTGKEYQMHYVLNGQQSKPSVLDESYYLELVTGLSYESAVNGYLQMADIENLNDASEPSVTFYFLLQMEVLTKWWQIRLIIVDQYL